MNVVLPGEADATVNLHGPFGGRDGGVAQPCLGGRHQGDGVVALLIERQAGAVEQAATDLHVDEAVRQPVAHGLEAADGLAKLHPLDGVLPAELERCLGAAQQIRGHQHGPDLIDLAQHGLAALGSAEQRVLLQPRVLEDDLGAVLGVHAAHRVDRHALRVRRDPHEAQAIGRARGHEQKGGPARVGHQDLAARKPPAVGPRLRLCRDGIGTVEPPRLLDRQRDPRLPPDQIGQELAAQRLVSAAFDGDGGHQRGLKRPGQHAPARLLGQHRGGHHVGADAPRLLGCHHTEPAHLDDLLPDLVVDHRRPFVQPLSRAIGGPALAQEVSRHLLEGFLFFAEIEIQFSEAPCLR